MWSRKADLLCRHVTGHIHRWEHLDGQGQLPQIVTQQSAMPRSDESSSLSGVALIPLAPFESSHNTHCECQGKKSRLKDVHFYSCERYTSWLLMVAKEGPLLKWKTMCFSVCRDTDTSFYVLHPLQSSSRVLSSALNFMSWLTVCLKPISAQISTLTSFYFLSSSLFLL